MQTIRHDNALWRAAAAMGLGLLALSQAGTAKAYDACAIYDLDNQQGAGIAVLLGDDTAAATYMSYGKTGYSAETAKDFASTLPGKGNSMFVNAGLSDVHLYSYQSHTYDVAVSPIDYGGNGTYFQGGTFGLRCPKGKQCLLNLNSYANKNQAWQCMREYYTKSPVVIPYQSSSMIKDGTANRRSIQDEWLSQVNSVLKNDKMIDAVKNATARVTLENYWSYCKRTGATNWNCTDTPSKRMLDAVRLHWEGDVNPNVSASDPSNRLCAYEKEITCAASIALPFLAPVCLWETITSTRPLCETVVGTHHVSIDTWLLPWVTDTKDQSPLVFNRGVTRVSVESGAGQSAIQSAIYDKAKATPIEQLALAGVHDAIGSVLCKADASKCVNKSPGQVGATFLGAGSDTTRVRRMQSAYFIGTDSTPRWAYYPPHSAASAGVVGAPEVLYMNFGRAF